MNKEQALGTIASIETEIQSSILASLRRYETETAPSFRRGMDPTAKAKDVNRLILDSLTQSLPIDGSFRVGELGGLQGLISKDGGTFVRLKKLNSRKNPCNIATGQQTALESDGRLQLTTRSLECLIVGYTTTPDFTQIDAIYLFSNKGTRQKAWIHKIYDRLSTISVDIFAITENATSFVTQKTGTGDVQISHLTKSDDVSIQPRLEQTIHGLTELPKDIIRIRPSDDAPGRITAEGN
jgi:hypothetical protein